MELLISNFEHRLRELADSATEIRVLIAFLTEAGLTWLPDDCLAISHVVVGIDLQITTTGALRRLQSGGADVRVFSERGRLFHPKAIYLKNNSSEHLVVGSNNLTAGGISSNHELAILCERNQSSNRVFEDFLAHYNWLLGHASCFEPDEAFYQGYVPSSISRELQSRAELALDYNSPRRAPATMIPDSAGGATLRGFLLLLCEQFPHLDRRQGTPLKDHPLKQVNDAQFLPQFQRIVTEASAGKLVAQSQLNIGGNWYSIPNILAVDDSREPYRLTHGHGRLLLQFHFSDDFSKVHMSMVLHYYVDRRSGAGKMPTAVANRFRRLLQHLQNYSPEAVPDGPAFHHWTYKTDRLWAKPIIGFEYATDELPGEQRLTDDLARLATALSGAVAIT